MSLDAHRAARIAAAAHGGQVLVSATTAELARAALSEGVELRDLGQHKLEDLDEPEHVFQLVVAGLPDKFPPVRSVGVLRCPLPSRHSWLAVGDSRQRNGTILAHTARLTLLVTSREPLRLITRMVTATTSVRDAGILAELRVDRTFDGAEVLA